MDTLKANKEATKYKKKSEYLQTQIDKLKEINGVLLNAVKSTISINCVCRGDRSIGCLRCLSVDAIKKAQEVIK